jgi:hypothetical protein
VQEEDDFVFGTGKPPVVTSSMLLDLSDSVAPGDREELTQPPKHASRPSDVDSDVSDAEGTFQATFVPAAGVEADTDSEQEDSGIVLLSFSHAEQPAVALLHSRPLPSAAEYPAPTPAVQEAPPLPATPPPSAQPLLVSDDLLLADAPAPEVHSPPAPFSSEATLHLKVDPQSNRREILDSSRVLAKKVTSWVDNSPATTATTEIRARITESELKYDERKQRRKKEEEGKRISRPQVAKVNTLAGL